MHTHNTDGLTRQTTVSDARSAAKKRRPPQYPFENLRELRFRIALAKSLAATQKCKVGQSLLEAWNRHN
jgi:hypothetical protein